jgi:hypothetical protein
MEDLQLLMSSTILSKRLAPPGISNVALAVSPKQAVPTM